MSNRNILNRIHAMLNGNVKLKQMTLDNGTVVEAESFEVGSMIYAIDGDNQAPLEVGTYTLDDGTTLEVTETGVIGEVATAKAEVEATKENDPMKAEMSSDDMILTVVQAFEPLFKAMNEKIDSLSSSNTELKSLLSKTTEVKATIHRPTEKKYSLSEIKNLKTTEARVMAMLNIN